MRTLIIFLFMGAALVTHAQKERSIFRKGYLRLGINNLGSSLSNSLSPQDNVFSGRYGCGTGYVLEAGHVFYFKKGNPQINYGLDLTPLSVTYNNLNKWGGYAKNAGVQNVTIDKPSLAFSVTPRLGPVVSFNPVEKLVIDVRVQVAYSRALLSLGYSENDGQANQRSFAFATGSDSTSETEVRAVSAGGLGYNLGISVRRKAIGIALDYLSNKVNAGYVAYDGNGNHTSGKEKIPFKNLQLKLSLTL